MILKIKVKTNQKHESVLMTHDLIVVCVKERPVEGRANKRVIELMAKELGVAKSHFKITSGRKSNLKMVTVNNVKTDNLVQLIQ